MSGKSAGRVTLGERVLKLLAVQSQTGPELARALGCHSAHVYTAIAALGPLVRKDDSGGSAARFALAVLEQPDGDSFWCARRRTELSRADCYDHFVDAVPVLQELESPCVGCPTGAVVRLQFAEVDVRHVTVAAMLRNSFGGGFGLRCTAARADRILSEALGNEERESWE